MSTYYNSNSDQQLDIDSFNLPSFAEQYCEYLLIEKNTAPRSVFNYAVSIRTFLRWVRSLSMGKSAPKLEDISISNMELEEIATLTTQDIYAFMTYCATKRNNSAKSRAAKLTAIKSFFDYLVKRNESGIVKNNPAADIATPKKEKSLPKYLSVDEAKALLGSVKGEANRRNYCILLWFLSCGMRLSELVAIDLKDIKDNTLRIYGKGRKERILYLNDLCMSALEDYLVERSNYKKIEDENALFISNRTGKRLTGRRVEQIVDKFIAAAGLQGNGYSAHKLRHSAATMLYRNGTGVIELQEILGHSGISLISLYTHTSGEIVKDAMSTMEETLGNNEFASGDVH